MQADILLDIMDEANKLPNNEERINTSEIDNRNSILNINDTFKDWDAVKVAVNVYAKQNGFVTIKYHKELDAINKFITRCRVYSCWKSGTSNPRKVDDISLYRNSTSIKMNCPWQVCFYFSKILPSYILQSLMIIIIINVIQ